MALIVRLNQTFTQPTNDGDKVISMPIYVNLDNVETIREIRNVHTNEFVNTEIIFPDRSVHVDEDFYGIFYPKDSNVIART